MVYYQFMKDFFHDAQKIINKELLLINQKIKSTTFLEILKFKLIDKLKDHTEHFHIYTFGGLKETNKWLKDNNYA